MITIEINSTMRYAKCKLKQTSWNQTLIACFIFFSKLPIVFKVIRYECFSSSYIQMLYFVIESVFYHLPCSSSNWLMMHHIENFNTFNANTSTGEILSPLIWLSWQFIIMYNFFCIVRNNTVYTNKNVEPLIVLGFLAKNKKSAVFTSESISTTDECLILLIYSKMKTFIEKKKRWNLYK